jgi:MarR family transcriptional regulator, organic hydroperoxide resistance regulator
MIYEDPKECPFYLVSRATLLMASAFKKAFLAAGIGSVRPAYLGVLWCLWNEDGVKTVDLGRAAGLEPSTMTGLLDRMERDGFVVRSADPADRRVQVIRITENGRNVRETAMRMVDETLALLFQNVSEDDLAKTKTVLRKVLENGRE